MVVLARFVVSHVLPCPVAIFDAATGGSKVGADRARAAVHKPGLQEIARRIHMRFAKTTTNGSGSIIVAGVRRLDADATICVHRQGGEVPLLSRCQPSVEICKIGRPLSFSCVLLHRTSVGVRIKKGAIISVVELNTHRAHSSTTHVQLTTTLLPQFLSPTQKHKPDAPFTTSCVLVFRQATVDKPRVSVSVMEDSISRMPALTCASAEQIALFECPRQLRELMTVFQAIDVNTGDVDAPHTSLASFTRASGLFSFPF